MPEVKKQPPTAKELQRSIYFRCASDPIFFLKNFVFIQTTDFGRVLFNVYLYQDKLLHVVNRHDRTIILKSRQLGITTLLAAYSLWKMIFQKDFSVLTVAPDRDKAKAVILKIQFAYDNLPAWLKEGCADVEHNKSMLRLSNGSKAEAVAGSKDATRSKTANFLIIDEAAFIKDADETCAAALQILATGGKCVMLSCVTKDTYVYTDNGIKKIENFYKENEIVLDYKLPEYKILGKDVMRVGELFHNNGLVKTKIINSVYSYLEGSENHKLYAYSNKDSKYDWYRLDQLSIGDYVGVQYGMEVWGKNDDVSSFNPYTSNRQKNKFKPTIIDEHISYLIGLYISEGSCHKVKGKNLECAGGAITITCGDDISQSILNVGLPYSSHDKLHYAISSKNLIDFFEYIGFDLSKKAKDKIIPERVLEISRDNIVQLLRGIFDGDGSVMKKGDDLRVSIGLSSKELIQQIRVILLNFGITSTYQEVLTKVTKKVKVRSQSYRLDLCHDSAKKFCDIIGFGLPRKIAVYENHIDREKRISNPCDIIPGFYNVIDEIKTFNKDNKLKSNTVCVNKLVKYKEKYRSTHLSRTNVLKFKDGYYEKLPIHIKPFFDNNVSDNIIWSKVTSITDSENYTYDFSLPENDDDWCHSVIYNGIIGHQTPNGAGGYFHEKWEEAEQNENAFVPVTLPWNVHPSHDQKWRDEQDKELGKRMAAQECDCEFNQSGDGYFEPDDVEYYKDLIEDPIETRGPSKDFWIWEFPIPNRSYMVILDTARGDGNDSSTIQVVDIFTGDQVAEYKGDMPPKLLAKFAVSVAIDYNSALLISENTGIGETTTTEVVDLQYSNIFYSPKGESTDITAYLAKNYENDISKMTAGFTMSTKTRPLVLHSFRQYTMDRSIKLRSRRIHSEMKTFIWKNAKPQARQGFNDDLIMPYAIGMYLRDSAIEKRNNSVDMTRATMAGIQKFTPMSAPMLQKNFVNPYLQNVNGKMEDISWLL